MYIPSIRPGRIASAIAAAVMTASLVAAPAYADSRVVATIGADLTPAQKQTVIDYFGSNMDGADIIYVTNEDEHAHLDGYIPYEQIGNATYSCALICPTTSGGIHVRAANLNYVTADMLASALSSAGVRNADVIAICPFKVSGTGALTGVLLAYETATGQPLDQAKKDVATQELVVTQTISNQVGSDAATLIVNDVKANVIMNNVTDESQIDAIVETTVNNVVNNTTINNVDNSTTIVDNSTTVIDNSTVNVTEATVNNNNPSGLTDEDIAALKELAKSYASAGYNYDDMAETLNTVSQNASAASGIADPMAKELADAAESAAKDNSAGSAGDTGAAGTTAGAAGAEAGAAGTPNAGTATDATGASGATTETAGAVGAATDAAGTGAGSADGAAAGTTTDTSATPGAGTTDAASTPTETPAPSIFDGTDDAALGDDVHVTATDQSAAADTTTTETSKPATDPNDPFASVKWDESGDASQQPGDQPTDGQSGTETTGAESGQPSSGEPAQAPDGTADTALPEPPAPAQSSSVTLVATATARATDLVDGTALTVFEENGQYGLADMVDGTRLTEAVYTNAFQATDGLVVATQAADGKMVLLDAQGKQLLSGPYDEVRVLSTKWALGIQRGSMEFDNAVDVYYLPDSTTMPAGTTTSDLLSDAQANGDYLNIVAASGAVSTYNASFMPVEGAVPADINDFSYAGMGAELEGTGTTDSLSALPAMDGTELAVDEATVASPAEGTAKASAQPAEGIAAPAEAATPEQPAEGMAAPADAAAAEQPADSTSATTGESAAVTALPQNAIELAGTNGLLYTATGTDNKTHLFDANGLDLFNLGFDQVISAHNGSAIVLVDKTADVAWAFQVKAPATL